MGMKLPSPSEEQDPLSKKKRNRKNFGFRRDK
jgi:hypothetical protein